MPREEASLHVLHFRENDIRHTPSATYTKSSPPVPPVPASDYQHHDITKILETLPHLFKVVTPINPNPLEELLINHPNKDLINLYKKRLGN